jgi:predicted Zn-dependent protease
MIKPDWLKEKLTPFTKIKEADKVGITFFRTNLQVSRFANSQVHQHMSDENQCIYFRVLIDGRLGIASTNSFDEHNLNETFKKALHMAQLKVEVKEKKDIPSFKPLITLPGFYAKETA